MAVDVMTDYSEGSIWLDGVEMRAGLDFAVNANTNALIVGKAYTFHADVFMHGERCLFAPLRAMTSAGSFDVCERYRFNAFAPNVRPVLNVYPGRSVVTRAAYFELITESRLAGAEPDAGSGSGPVGPTGDRSPVDGVPK